MLTVAKLILVLFGILFFTPLPARALEPEEILVMVNRKAEKSEELGTYYMKKRRIPAKNLIRLSVTDQEVCSRLEYEKKIAEPVRRYVKKLNRSGIIRALVIMYGLPLKVEPPIRPFTEADRWRPRLKKNRLIDRQADSPQGTKEGKQKDERQVPPSTREKASYWGPTDSLASIDSEIALVLEKDYPLPGWVPNPYYLGFKDRNDLIKRDNVLMVSRLDGPSEKIVRRIINDSFDAEEKGLKGVAYFDARSPDPGHKRLSGYAFYDQSIHRAAGRVKESGRMPVVIESTQKLFQQGDCPEAALYAGWYSLANYVDAFTWQRGSVGYHIASSECVTLKKANSRVWCKRMLEKGIAATVGPVGEPFVDAFPVPEIFFEFLVDGYLSLAEVYLISTPFLSWKMVLIGDPLYRPFKNAPKP